MVLSDRDIRRELKKRRIIIAPLDPSSIQPASVDLRLGRQLRVFQRHRLQVIDIKQEMAHLTELVEIDEVNPFVLHPGEFALGVTLEEVCLPHDVVGRLDGKSSLGRLGLVVHSTAGFVDPGWRGHLTLELSNAATLPINLYSGMKVSQISFLRLSSPAERPYGSAGLGSKYQGQSEPTPSRAHLDYQRTPPRHPASKDNRTLRDWLKNSPEFKGNVGAFAGALPANRKTVEDWIYRGTTPSRKYWERLFELTQLTQFRPQGEAGQGQLIARIG